MCLVWIVSRSPVLSVVRASLSPPGTVSKSSYPTVWYGMVWYGMVWYGMLYIMGDDTE